MKIALLKRLLRLLPDDAYISIRQTDTYEAVIVIELGNEKAEIGKIDLTLLPNKDN